VFCSVLTGCAFLLALFAGLAVLLAAGGEDLVADLLGVWVTFLLAAGVELALLAVLLAAGFAAVLFLALGVEADAVFLTAPGVFVLALTGVLALDFTAVLAGAAFLATVLTAALAAALPSAGLLEEGVLVFFDVAAGFFAALAAFLALAMVSAPWKVRGGVLLSIRPEHHCQHITSFGPSDQGLAPNAEFSW